MDAERKAPDLKPGICGANRGDGCGRPIVWAELESGGRVPLDPRAPVYSYTMHEDRIVASRNKGAMVSHFATCPKASNFTRPKTGGA